MLVKFAHSQSHGLSEEGASVLRYETMQCFALTQPRAMMEEGEGTRHNRDIISAVIFQVIESLNT